MSLFLAKHGLFFCDYAAAYATFRWLCFRLCSIFRGHICPKKAIMLLAVSVLHRSHHHFLRRPPLPPRRSSRMDRNSTLRTAVVSWCSVVCTAVLLAADCSLLVPPTVFSVLCVGVCASCFFVSFVLADCRCSRVFLCFIGYWCIFLR